MAVYYDWKTIREILGQRYYREDKVFTVEELGMMDGSGGRPAYVAVNGIVYDVSREPSWGGGTHFSLVAGKDLTEEFEGCHKYSNILNKLVKVGILKK